MNVVYCDRCAEGSGGPIGLVIGRKSDAAGSTEDVTLDADLCSSCQADYFRQIIDLAHHLGRDSEFSQRIETFLRSRTTINEKSQKMGGSKVFKTHP
jgi:hypothetical protein